MRPLRTNLLFGLLLLTFPAALAGDPPVDDAAVRRLGLKALPALLRDVEAADPDVRIRARRLAKRVVADFFEAQTPPGMRLIPGRIAVGPDGVRVEGGLYLGIHEVTLGALREFAARQEWDPARWSAGEAAWPAANVSLNEARMFARARDARLPTRDEWRRAATGGDRLRYPWGDRFDARRVNTRESGRGRLEPVGSHPAGRSVHGIADLIGNVAEWTETSAGGKRNRAFLIVGGSFRQFARNAPDVTYRLAANARLDDVGFRLARSLPSLPEVAAPKGS